MVSEWYVLLSESTSSVWESMVSLIFFALSPWSCQAHQQIQISSGGRNIHWGSRPSSRLQWSCSRRCFPRPFQSLDRHKRQPRCWAGPVGRSASSSRYTLEYMQNLRTSGAVNEMLMSIFLSTRMQAHHFNTFKEQGWLIATCCQQSPGEAMAIGSLSPITRTLWARHLWPACVALIFETIWNWKYDHRPSLESVSTYKPRLASPPLPRLYYSDHIVQ